MVTLAAEGAVCVLTEAVVATDGFIDALINICKARAHREGSITLIFTASLCTIVLQTAVVNTVLVLQNKHRYHFELTTTTTEITAIITCQTECTDETIHYKGFQTLVFGK